MQISVLTEVFNSVKMYSC